MSRLVNEHKGLPLETEIQKTICTDATSIAMLDITFNAIQPTQADAKHQTNKNAFTAFFFGTQQIRSFILQENLPVNKKYYSGPTDYVFPDFDALKKQPIQDFCDWVDSQNFADGEEIPWVMIGHSRGGVLARHIAHHPKFSMYYATKLIEFDFENGNITITPIADAKDASPPKPILCKLKIHIFGYSSTAGTTNKDKPTLTNLPRSVTSYTEVLSAGATEFYFKPQNQRRTIYNAKHVQPLMVHVPVRHPVVTKAEHNQILHMEIIVLLQYLQLKHIGVDVDFKKLQIPMRIKAEGKPTRTEYKSIEAKELEQPTVTNCVKVLKRKWHEFKAELKNEASPYAKKLKAAVNLHEKTDQRLLVIRSAKYDSVLEERLATIADGKEEAGAEKLFNPVLSNEELQFNAFAQHVLNKQLADDPTLSNPAHLPRFYRLKMNVFVKDKKLVTNALHVIDHALQNMNLPGLGYHDLVNELKQFVLSALENTEVNTTQQDCKIIFVAKIDAQIKAYYKAGKIGIQNYLDIQASIIKERLPLKPMSDDALISKILPILKNNKWESAKSDAAKLKDRFRYSLFSCCSAKPSLVPDGIAQLRENTTLVNLQKTAQSRLESFSIGRDQSTEDFYHILKLLNSQQPERNALIADALDAFCDKYNFPPVAAIAAVGAQDAAPPLVFGH